MPNKIKNDTYALSALRIGNYYGKIVGKALIKDYQLPLLLSKTKKEKGLSNACLCFLKEFLPAALRPIFENTNTELTASISSDFLTGKLHFEFQTHNPKKK